MRVSVRGRARLRLTVGERVRSDRGESKTCLEEEAIEVVAEAEVAVEAPVVAAGAAGVSLTSSITTTAVASEPASTSAASASASAASATAEMVAWSAACIEVHSGTWRCMAYTGA